MLEDEVPRPSRSSSVLLWFLLPLTVISVQLFVYAPKLPGRVASHFDLAGNPDGWMSRSAFLGLFAGLGYGLAALFVFLTWLAPRLPVSMVNIPHREYWLAPERRDESFAAMIRNLTGHGMLTLGLIAWLFYETYRVNTVPDGGATMHIGWPLGLFLGGTGLLLVLLFLRFGKPPADPS